jgi:ABC-type phosphate/phosphonate transport system substrate-binding protein
MRPITLLLPAARPGLTQQLRAQLHEIVQLAVAAPVALATLPAALLPQVLDGPGDAIAWAPALVARDLVRLRLASEIAVADAGADYAATLIVRPSIESLVDITRQRVGWVSRVSATGYQIPRMYLESFGVELSAFFASERFYGSHEGVARALAAGEIDVGATHSGRLREMLGPSQGRILTSIGPVPADLLLASTGLPLPARLAITQALLSSTLGPIRFTSPRPGHLDLFDLLHASETPSVRGAMPCTSGVIAIC